MANYLDLDDLKKHLRIDFDDDDAYILDLMDMVEEIVLTEIQGSVNGEGTVSVSGGSGVTGVETTFTDYTVGDIIKVENETNRTITGITDDTHLGVSGVFTGTDTGLIYILRPGIPSPIPVGLKHAMMLMAGHFYNNRESTIIGVGVNKIPYGFEYLVNPYKNWTIG
jgi:hypothetical protein